jgi:homoprotocatechuate degradation regulator HpaR
MKDTRKLLPYRRSLAGTLLTAREAVMAPIRPVLRQAGVTEQQWRVLRVLADEGPTEPSRLSGAALLMAPSVSRILRELEERGLVRRDADPGDGRRSIVMISPAGRALVRRTARHTLDVLESYAARFGATRLQTLMAELQTFISAIQSADPSLARPLSADSEE